MTLGSCPLSIFYSLGTPPREVPRGCGPSTREPRVPNGMAARTEQQPTLSLSPPPTLRGGANRLLTLPPESRQWSIVFRPSHVTMLTFENTRLAPRIDLRLPRLWRVTCLLCWRMLALQRASGVVGWSWALRRCFTLRFSSLVVWRILFS